MGGGGGDPRPVSLEFSSFFRIGGAEADLTNLRGPTFSFSGTDCLIDFVVGGRGGLALAVERGVVRGVVRGVGRGEYTC